MDVKKQFQEAQDMIANRQFEAAATIYKTIMEENEGTDTFYWALKHLGDVAGYIGFKDYYQSIDIYQKIITEYEGEDDALYEVAQIDVARAYLEMGLEMIANFDNTISIYEPQTEKMQHYKQMIVDKRNDFIEKEAQLIYKERM